MFKEILEAIAEWVLTHMITSISRRLYPDKKIMERVRVSIQAASVYIPPNIPLVKMTLEIRNTLASAIDLLCVYGDIKTFDYVLVNNFTKCLAKTLKKHSDEKNCELIFDLPDAVSRIIGTHTPDQFFLQLKGALMFKAMGRTLTNSIDSSIYVHIEGLKKSVENSK